MTQLDINFMEQILAIVEEIPPGKVATYGQIAKLSGHPKNSRLVGTALKNSNYFGTYPCHRVVGHDGQTVKGWTEQTINLKQEGVTFKNGKVDLKKHKWDINV